LEELVRRGLTVPQSEATQKIPKTLFDFASSSLAFELHPWQRLYCELLDRLRTEKGLRLLVHGPPQYGKTILTSQRLPAFLLGHDPKLRVGVACYNETHAANQTAVVRDLMASPEYRAWFPASAVTKDVSAKEFSTAARLALHDGQVSVKAFGLLSGFTGRGVDCLLIDDPYASADAARSEAINGAVWRWWSQTAKVRMKADSNIVVMFHRYHDDDLAAKLEKEGGWELYRFPAIADGDDAAGIDLTLAHGLRTIGEPLSPMRTLEELEKLKAEDAQTFASQFQGTPQPDTGGMFQVHQIKVLPARPANVILSCRAWDIAATAGGGDYTAGVRIDKLSDGRFVISDVVLLQGGPDEVDRVMDATAATDGRKVSIHIAQDPGSAGKRDAQAIARRLAGYSVKVESVSGPKDSRARGLASQVNVANVDIVNQPTDKVRTGPYSGKTVTEALRSMLANFPIGTAKKDGVDAAADAFNELSRVVRYGAV
jgi:hypothetical protein